MDEAKTGQRVVRVRGGVSTVLDGDPDAGLLRGEALPTLLHEGWRIEREVAVGSELYLILGGKPAVAPLGRT